MIDPETESVLRIPVFLRYCSITFDETDNGANTGMMLSKRC